MKRAMICTVTLATLSLALALAGCGGEPEADADATSDFEAATQAGDTAAAMDAARRLNEEGGAELTRDQIASPGRLRAFLPDTFADLPRGALSSDAPDPRSPVLAASAEAAYHPAEGSRYGEPSVNLSITDLGSMAGMLRMIRPGIDRTDGSTRIRSVTIAGYDALEESDSDAGTAELQLAVPGRILITATGQGVSADALREHLAAMDLESLARQAGNGELAEPTLEERTPLPDPDTFAAALPQRLPGNFEHVGGGAFEMDQDGIDFVQVQANYRHPQGVLSVTVQAFKSERHAREAAPLTPEALARTSMVPDAAAEDVQQVQWAGHELMLLESDQVNQAVASAGVGSLVIRVQGSDAATVQQAFEALEIDELQAAARPRAEDAR